MLKTAEELLWGPGTLGLLLGTGIFLLLRTSFLPWRNLGFALRCAMGRDARRSSRCGVSPFSALMTSLAATLGTGNIVGVATALVAGGPGALVWMEVSALLGLGTIFSESLLAVKYRRKNAAGRWVGGPMYVMAARLGPAGRILGAAFACFAACAALGIGSMTQANAAAAALYDTLQIPPLLSGTVMAALALGIIADGIRSIAGVSAVLVPVIGGAYLLAGCAVILLGPVPLSAALGQMLRQAVSFRAAAGGAAGLAAMRWGVARGIFSNEAGLGSAAIAAAAAETDDPVRQACVSMTAPIFDTVIMCTVTGLAICCSGALGTMDAAGQAVNGAALTILAFSSVSGPFGGLFVALSIVFFAFSTILGWEYLGETAFEFLSRGRFLSAYRLLFILAVPVGAAASLGSVFRFSDVCNALMCIPNLLCLLLLSGEVAAETHTYEKKKKL